MARTVVLTVAVAVICCLALSVAVADRLILIPTGSTLKGLKAEYATSPDLDDAKIYWANVGLSKFEVEGAKFQDFGGDDVDTISAQVAVLPETSFTPAVALGVRDISDEADGKGLPYGGRSVYLAISKEVPVTGGIPVLFRDMKLHGGIATDALSGVFFGVEGTLPIGLRIAAEYDTDDFNWAASYGVIPTLKAKVSSIKGDIYYGAVFSASF